LVPRANGPRANGPRPTRIQVVNPAQICAAIGLIIGSLTGTAIGLTPGPATAETAAPIVQSSPRQLLAPKPPDRQSELWWTKDQIEAELKSSKLISRWSLSTDSPNPLASSLASPLATGPATGPATLDVTINSQAWSLLDYFGRYEFANTLGIKAHELGYGLRIMSDRGIVLGQYSCAMILPGQPSVTASPSQCRVQLDSIGQRGSRNRALF
jgi:hypothetical protein